MHLLKRLDLLGGVQVVIRSELLLHKLALHFVEEFIDLRVCWVNASELGDFRNNSLDFALCVSLLRGAGCFRLLPLHELL